MTSHTVSPPDGVWFCALCNMPPRSVFQTVFALWGKGTRGLKTPGYSKTVLRTESAAAAPYPFKYLHFQWCGQLQMTAPTLRNMQRYGLAHCSAAAMVNQAPAIPCTPRPHKFSPQCSPICRTNSNRVEPHAPSPYSACDTLMNQHNLTDTPKETPVSANRCRSVRRTVSQ